MAEIESVYASDSDSSSHSDPPSGTSSPRSPRPDKTKDKKKHKKVVKGRKDETAAEVSPKRGSKSKSHKNKSDDPGARVSLDTKTDATRKTEVLTVPLTDEDAALLEKQWRAVLPKAAILPEVGLPSKNHGAVTITHFWPGKPVTYNGVPSHSYLNASVFSSELTGGRYLNIYRLKLPDTPGDKGTKSLVQQYTRALRRQGFEVTAMSSAGAGTGWLEVQHQDVRSAPQNFVERTLLALKAVLPK